MGRERDSRGVGCAIGHCHALYYRVCSQVAHQRRLMKETAQSFFPASQDGGVAIGPPSSQGAALVALSLTHAFREALIKLVLLKGCCG